MIKFKKILMLTLATASIFAMNDNEGVTIRPWGNYYVIKKISDTERVLLCDINAYAVTSLHYHKYRDESFVTSQSGLFFFMGKDSQAEIEAEKSVIAYELSPNVPSTVHQMTLECMYNSNPYPISYIERQVRYNTDIQWVNDAHRIIRCEDMSVFKDMYGSYKIARKTKPYVMNKCTAFRDNIGW